MAIKNSKTLMAWPLATGFVVILNCVTYGIERNAMSWGVIGPLIKDFSFHLLNFEMNPLSQFPTLISYTFLHADGFHLASNMAFFLVFGPAVERQVGSAYFLFGYFLGGIAAALTQGYFSPFGGGLIGASGAVSWTAGAFLVLFPLRLPSRFFGQFLGPLLSKVPAFFYIGFWFLSQFRGGFVSLLSMRMETEVAMIAHWAHIGGFAVGALMVLPWIGLKSK